MDDNDRARGNKRLVLSLSGAMDALIGAVLLLVGLGFLPINVADYGLPRWLVILPGALMFAAGTGIAVYNFARRDE